MATQDRPDNNRDRRTKALDEAVKALPLSKQFEYRKQAEELDNLAFNSDNFDELKLLYKNLLINGWVQQDAMVNLIKMGV